ncbi:desmoplakin [Fundulus heteroclitus]|uniref:desmoplakin n=1 Tax=Fundulus heteroclitus TaxID=8078 RepID=UPI00165C90A7|nr:desmoplakin [Fundulus heteroclitus]
MEVQKVRGDVEISQLKQRIQEQEVLLTEREAQVEKLEVEVETQRKTIEDLNFQNAKLEHDVSQYQTQLDIAMKDKAATEQELKHTKLLMEQSEATWSLTQRKLEELLKKEIDAQKPAPHRKINAAEDDFIMVEELHIEGPAKSVDQTVQPLGIESQSEPDLEGSEVRMQDVLQQRLDELSQVQKKAEMAEEKAQSYKKLLDDSNNRLKKLQMDIESERVQTRQRSEDFHQEMLNMKRSISEFQEEIRSLQRAKSSLEQNSFFQSTEVEGLKEQLKITQTELQKKSAIEQENSYKINTLEEEVASKQAALDQLKIKCNDLMKTNISSDANIRGLQIQTESLEKERSFSEQRIKSLKSEAESWRGQLQSLKDENVALKRIEQELQVKCKNLEAELEDCEAIASRLERKLDEQKQMHLEVEQNAKKVKAKLDRVLMEVESKDQQIQILRSQVEGAKSQVRIIEEELNKKSQTIYELQIKLQEHSEESKTADDLQQKIKSLHGKIVSYEKETTSLKSELQSVVAEKNLASQKVLMQKAEINDLNEMLKKKNVELQNESDENRKHLSKAKALEEELFKHKHSFKGITNSSEKVIENLKQEIYSLQNDKATAERKVDSLSVKLSEFSSALQRTKEELAQETKDRKLKESKMILLETEVQKLNLSIKDATSGSDISRSNLQHENTILKREKSEALERNLSLGTELRTLKDKLLRAQTDVEKKQRENSGLQLRSQQLEEQLENCKKMLEELKGKLELQKEGYERQLSLMQTEIEKKMILLQSEIAKEGQQSQSRDLAEKLNKCFKQDVNLIKTLQHIKVESGEQIDKELQIKREKTQQETTKLVQDLLKAKSEIAQLEDDKLKLTSKISTLQSLGNQQSKERAKLEQNLADSERKLTLTEKEAGSLREQIELYGREVKSLQKTLSTLGGEVMETVRPNVANSRADPLKADATTEKKMTAHVTATKSRMDDETLNIKEMEKTKTVRAFEGIKQVKECGSLYETPNIQPKDLQHITHKSKMSFDLSSSVKAHGYMALCGPTDPRQTESSVSKTRTYQSRENNGSANASEKSTGNAAGKLGAATSQKPRESIRRADVQHLITHNLLDEGVLRQLEMGLLTVEQVQASLPRNADKPATVAGVYVESSKKKTSFLEAVEKGFLAKTYALEFLEAQAATGTLVDLATGERVSVAEALEKGIVDLSMKEKLMEAEKAVCGYSCKGRKLSVFQAMEERVLDRYTGKKMLEVQVASGGLINPETGARVPTLAALHEGLLSKETLQSLYDPVSNPKGFHSPDTGQKAYYVEILKTCLYDVNGGVFLVPFGERRLTNTSPVSPHRMSVVDSGRGSEMSVYEAFKGKHIDKRTYLFLSQQESSWQENVLVDPSGAPRHFIADARSGRQLCLESALSQRCLEKLEFESYRSGLLSIYEIADVIFSRRVVVEDANSTIAGFWDVIGKKRLSVLQGLQQGFTDRVTALRLLESQACTGGICDPSSGEKHALSDALRTGLLDEALKQQLQQFEAAFSGITHPQTGKVLSVLQAVQEKLLPKDVGFRCVEFQLLTGGLINPETKGRVGLEEVIQSSSVDAVTATLLKDEKFQTQSLTCPKTKRRITFREALERSVFDCHTGLRLLEATKVHAFGAKTAFHYLCAFK